MAEPTFWFICGDDDFLVHRTAREALAKATASVLDPMSVEVIDGRVQTVDEVVAAIGRLASAVQTVSLFGDRKVVWFRQISFLGEGRTASAEGTKKEIERLQEILESVDPAAVHLILSASPFDKRRAFAKWVQKTPGFTERSGGKDGSGFDAVVHEVAAARGVRIGPEALEVLRLKINGDLRMAAVEMEKLALAIDQTNAEITPRTVIEEVPEFGEAQFFEAAEVFYTGTLAESLEALRRFFFTHKEGRPLLAVLMNRNRLQMLVRALLDSGDLQTSARGVDKKSLESAAARYTPVFGDPSVKDPTNVFVQNPWYLGRLAASTRRFNLKQLFEFQQAFLDCFRDLIDRPNDQEEVFRDCFLRCLAPD